MTSHVIESEGQLRALFPPTHDLAIKKCLDHIDAHARTFISLSPFLCIGTQTPGGRADVSPRGDPPGFVVVQDAKTLLIPDRPGNNRLDSLSNIVANPSVGLLFMIPGFDETMRVNGTAQVSCDPDLLDKFAVEGRRPKVVIVVSIDEVFIHCAKAFRRSNLWDATSHQDRDQMPSLMKIVLDQSTGAPDDAQELQDLEDQLEESYRNTLY